MGACFSRGGEKSQAKHIQQSPCQITSRGCLYPASGLYSALLITASLAAESKSLTLLTLGFPRQRFGTAPAPYFHARQPLSKTSYRAALCSHQALDLQAPIMVEEGLVKTLRPVANPPAAKGSGKDALELEVRCCDGPKHTTPGLAFGSVPPEDHSSALPRVQRFQPS